MTQIPNGGQLPAKPWYAFAVPFVGKSVRLLARVARHGGSALPGKVAEQMDPGFLRRALAQLPLGVVLVSGTNGKTTTTRMVASMLTELGLKVFTNPTGSNFTRGVASALLREVDLTGRLDADIAVLELDEAYAVHFVRQVKPRFSLLLNVMRDQLDRFGEIDNTARLLSHVAEATTTAVVLNREDPRISALASCVRPATETRYFGLAPSLRSFFPSDDDMHGSDAGAGATATKLTAEDLYAIAEQSVKGGEASVDAMLAQTGAGAGAEGSDAARASGESPDSLAADVTLTQVGDHTAGFRIGGDDCSSKVRLEGVYNLFNAAGALAMVRAILAHGNINTPKNVDARRLMEVLSTVTPAFGRGEVIEYQGAPIELVLVKNPMGFRLSLASFEPAGTDTMIAICDEYADGRDMSWLWDVDFSSLKAGGVEMVSGKRAWDMSLRLGYDRVPVKTTNTNLSEALTDFVSRHPGRPKRIYCTYTSMLKVRQRLSHITDVADAGVGR